MKLDFAPLKLCCARCPTTHRTWWDSLWGERPRSGDPGWKVDSQPWFSAHRRGFQSAPPPSSSAPARKTGESSPALCGSHFWSYSEAATSSLQKEEKKKWSSCFWDGCSFVCVCCRLIGYVTHSIPTWTFLLGACNSIYANMGSLHVGTDRKFFDILPPGMKNAGELNW